MNEQGRCDRTLSMPFRYRTSEKVYMPFETYHDMYGWVASAYYQWHGITVAQLVSYFHIVVVFCNFHYLWALLSPCECTRVIVEFPCSLVSEILICKWWCATSLVERYRTMLSQSNYRCLPVQFNLFKHFSSAPPPPPPPQRSVPFAWHIECVSTSEDDLWCAVGIGVKNALIERGENRRSVLQLCM